MRPVTVVCKRDIVERLKAAAVSSHPREMYAVLLGRRRGNRFTIRDLWFPDGTLGTARSTRSIVNLPTLASEAAAIAESENLAVLGDAHSHTTWQTQNACPSEPSEADWRENAGRLWLTGICAVRIRKRGKPQVTLHFWPPIQRVRVQLIPAKKEAL